jgi:hypothetical protein
MIPTNAGGLPQDVHFLYGCQLRLAIGQSAKAAAAATGRHGVDMGQAAQRLKVVLPFDPLLGVVGPQI